MRRLAGGIALAATLLYTGAASAKGVNNLLAGINGIITAPAEPVMQVIEPPEALQQFPGGAWVAHPLGLLSGTTQLIYQLMMGVCDLAFTPFWIMPTLSPEPRWQPIPDVEYE